MAEEVGQMDGWLEQDAVSAVTGQMCSSPQLCAQPGQLAAEPGEAEGGWRGFVGRRDLGDGGVGQMVISERKQMVSDAVCVASGREPCVAEVGSVEILVRMNGHRVKASAGR
ncbi:hypothetical protein GCM10009639_14630 [Kitasatospora putterlickiae]|uniref:Uncharacterized protein n=1 Tax=Kitasatospora putterlickiae TaxID=221725 RepID=A0ABP4IJW9_9ACTN